MFLLPLKNAQLNIFGFPNDKFKLFAQNLIEEFIFACICPSFCNRMTYTG